jgi:nitrogen fixation NifU-like protein
MDMRELYHDVILDHNKRPRNRGRIPAPTHSAEGFNPLCGDAIVLDLIAKDGIIQDIKFDGQGCAISTASASLMTEAVRGKPLQTVEEILREAKAMLTGIESEIGPHIAESELEALGGVREFPVRIKCAILPWNALQAALSGAKSPATSE